MNLTDEIDKLDPLRAMIRRVDESLELTRAVIEHRAVLLRRRVN